jgi:hypothetical protein
MAGVLQRHRVKREDKAKTRDDVRLCRRVKREVVAP